MPQGAINVGGIDRFHNNPGPGLALNIISLIKNVFQWYFINSRYGKRKTWHLIGTVCVVAAFPFIFLGCIGCSNAAPSYLPTFQMGYFIFFIVVFQFGWAATQISHLAMIPELTNSQNERTGLTAIRYSATIISNISVYLLAWAFLGKLGQMTGIKSLQ